MLRSRTRRFKFRIEFRMMIMKPQLHVCYQVGLGCD